MLLGSFQAGMNPYASAPLRGIPFGFLLDIHVTDADGATAQIRHPAVFDQPSKDLLAYAKKVDERQAAQEESVRRASLERAAQKRDMSFFQSTHPFSKSPIRPDPSLPVVWNVRTPVELSKELRRVWPAQRLEMKELTVEGLAAFAVMQQSDTKRFESELNWKHRDGSDQTDTLVELERGQLMFKPGSQRRSVSLFALSDRSILDAFQLVRPHFKGLEANSTYYNPERESFKRSGVIAGATKNFQNDYGCLPPRAIYSDDEKALLSWRVMILPYLGYQHLFSLFRLDEPWDSKHNAKLIPFMPPIYAGTQGGQLEPGKATIQGLVGQNAWYKPNGICFAADFEQSFQYTLSHVESTVEHAVAWTAPEDLSLNDQLLATKILKGVENVAGPNGKRIEKPLFHGITSDTSMVELPFDEQALRATATLAYDGASVLSLIPRP